MKKGLIKGLLLFTLLVVVPCNIKAAVTFTVTKDKDNIKPGEQVQVIVKVSGQNDTDSLYGYDLSLSFDSSKLEWVSDGGSSLSSVSPNGNVVSIKSKNNDQKENKEIELAKINLKATNSGSANLGLSGSCTINDEDGGDKCKYNSASLTIKSFGTDASLSSLSIPNTTISPDFSPSVTEYKAKVKDVKEIKISATPTDSSAKVQISDNYKSLKKGDNNIDIVVTSEDGVKKMTYTVVVNLELTPTEEELKKADATLKSLTVKEQKIDFDSTEKKYYITVNNDVTKLTITATPKNEKAKVEVAGNKKLNVGKNTVTVTVTSEDATKKEVYQIIVTRKEAKKEVVHTCPDVTSTKEWIIFSVTMLFTFTLGIVLGYFLCKKDVLKKLFKKKEKKEEPAYIETLSDTIDLSDTVKEVKKETKKKN